ncbi:hypothetical protein AB4Z09_28580 [Rhodococcus sp. TAF43]|uniref:hypothetical protein n=1 Tax=Rhodococcus sp. TAF43 TaxID=3237483 RepID=UPI003F99FCD6
MTAGRRMRRSPGDLQGLTLAESDFPAGSQYYVVPDPQEYGQQLTDAIAITTFDPAECKQPREEQARIGSTAAQAAVNAQTATGSVYVAAVAKGDSETRTLVDRMLSGPCAIVTTERMVGGVVVDSTVTETTRTDAPSDLRADESIVYRQRVEVTSRLTGDTSSPTASFRTVGYAWVGPYRVMLEQTSTESSAQAGEEFDALFRIAVAKTG